MEQRPATGRPSHDVDSLPAEQKSKSAASIALMAAERQAGRVPAIEAQGRRRNWPSDTASSIATSRAMLLGAGEAAVDDQSPGSRVQRSFATEDSKLGRSHLLHCLPGRRMVVRTWQFRHCQKIAPSGQKRTDSRGNARRVSHLMHRLPERLGACKLGVHLCQSNAPDAHLSIGGVGILGVGNVSSRSRTETTFETPGSSMVTP